MITFDLRNSWRRIAVAIGALGLAGAATAAALPNLATDFVTAKAQFEAGRAGSHDATERAQQLFSQLLRKDAENPLYLAYYGSTYALQARDSAAPWTRIKLINQGNALLDRALALLDQAPATTRPVTAHPGAGTAGTAGLETRLLPP